MKFSSKVEGYCFAGGLRVFGYFCGFFTVKMSGQGPPAAHKVRRNVSPSQTRRQGPMKAVMPFILKHSPSRSPSSPTLSSLAVLQRRSPVADRLSPDSRRSPSSPGSYKGSRPKLHAFLPFGWHFAMFGRSSTLSLRQLTLNSSY